MPRASIKPNSIAVPSGIKGDFSPFRFAISTFWVLTKIREVNTPRRYSPTIPKVETMPAAPKSPYAAGKYQAEQHCRSFRDQGRLLTVSLRYFNVLGPYQNPRSEYAAAVQSNNSKSGNYASRAEKPLCRGQVSSRTALPFLQGSRATSHRFASLFQRFGSLPKSAK